MKFTFADFLLIVGFLMLVVPIFILDLLVGSAVTGFIAILFALKINKYEYK